MSEYSLEVAEELLRKVSDGFQKEKNEAIFEAITDCLGKEWSPEDLAQSNRVEAVYHYDGRETYYLDGRSLIEFAPMQTTVSQQSEGASFVMKATQKYDMF